MRDGDLTVIACGSRDWTDCVTAEEIAHELPPGTTVIHGDCRGADWAFERAARLAGHETVAVPAGWDVYGMKAGPIRNSDMLRMLLRARRAGKRVGVIAMHDDPHLGTGTRDMVRKTLKHDIPTLIVTHVDGVVIP